MAVCLARTTWPRITPPTPPPERIGHVRGDSRRPFGSGLARRRAGCPAREVPRPAGRVKPLAG
jgi:hypothetical protein